MDRNDQSDTTQSEVTQSFESLMIALSRLGSAKRAPHALALAGQLVDLATTDLFPHASSRQLAQLIQTADMLERAAQNCRTAETADALLR